MVTLVKYMIDGRKNLLSKNAEIEMQDCGMLIKFPTSDKRKPSYAVLVDNDSVVELVNTMLKHHKSIASK